MQLNSSNPSTSPQLSNSPSSSSTNTRPAFRRRRPRPRPRPRPQPPPSSTSPHSSTPKNLIQNQSNNNSSSYSSHPTNSTPIFISIAVPLPVFRGLPGECPVSHLTLFNRLFPSPDHISRNFALTLLDNAALWYDLAVHPHPMSWDETKRAFLRAFRPPGFADAARAELVSLRQGDGESVNSYHLRMQWILRRWMDHGLPESLVRGLFVDGLRDEFHDWVAAKKPEAVEEAVRLAMDWEEATAGRKTRGKAREEWMRRRMREGENVVEEEEKMGRVVSIGSVGRKSQCQCWKHQCWKKYERSGSAVEGDAAASATVATTAGDGQVGGICSVERVGGMMMAVGVFLLNLLFFCMQCW